MAAPSPASRSLGPVDYHPVSPKSRQNLCIGLGGSNHQNTQKAGGKPGHPDHHQMLLLPTTIREVQPARCVCGNTAYTLRKPYYTLQVLELPPIAMDVTHWVSHQGWCPACGCSSKAQVPAKQATG